MGIQAKNPFENDDIDLDSVEGTGVVLDADEPGLSPRNQIEMKHQYQQHGNGAHSVNVGPVFDRAHRWSCCRDHFLTCFQVFSRTIGTLVFNDTRLGV